MKKTYVLVELTNVDDDATFDSLNKEVVEAMESCWYSARVLMASINQNGEDDE